MDLDLRRTFRFVTAISLGVLVVATSLHAGLTGFGGRRSVGGVVIDASGVVRAASPQQQHELAELMRRSLQPLQGDLAEAAEMRTISLKGLQQAISESHREGKPVADEVAYLAGLQRIEYVFVDEARNDILIAGPAEPWELRDDGFVVGTESGSATMRLADLLVAMRTVESARRAGITCSIEPTPEGRRRLQQLLRRIKLRPGQNPAIFESAMREAFGPQMIHLTGIPGDSRFARTLVAADFEMKRVAMGLTPSPVTALPSYLQMAKNSSQSANQNPRWWMACDYESLSRSEDGLAWKLSGQGIKTLTEQDVVAADGSVQAAGKTDRLAQLWADKMTDHFAELSKAKPVFSDLQKLMDLTIVATLIAQERLDQQASLDLSVLRGGENTVELISYEVPKAVDPQCSFIRGRNGWVVTASGGVDINAFQVVEDQTVDRSIADVRASALASADSTRWFWDN